MAPNTFIFTAPIGDKPLNLKAVFNLKNWIKGRYAIYKGIKGDLDYIGKARGGIEFRYSAAKIQEMGVDVIKGLENLPNNATALGVEQLIIDLNGGAGTGELVIDLNGGAGTGELANKIPATIKEIYINEARYWLDTNMPNWEQILKFK